MAIVYKNLQFPEKDYQQLCDLARQSGFRVSRGRGSQLRLFVMAAANNCVQADVAKALSEKTVVAKFKKGKLVSERVISPRH